MSNQIAIEIMSREDQEEKKELGIIRSQTEERASNRLGDILAGMIAENIFYARIISHLRRRAVWDQNLTIGHEISDGRFILKYNPNYLTSVGHIELMDRMEHECIHVINNHIKRVFDLLGVSSVRDAVQKLKDPRTKAAINLATDFAVNYELWLQKHKKKPIEGRGWPMANDEFFKLDLNLPMETYYDLLKQELPPSMNNSQGEGDGDGENDQNKEGGSSDCEDKESGKGKGKGKAKGKKDKQNGKGDSQSMSGMMDTINSQHDWFGEKDLNEEQSQCEFDQLNKSLISTIERAISDQLRARGEVPARYMEMIKNLYKTRKVPWNKLLRQRVHGTFIDDKEPCYYRPKRNLIHLEAEGHDVCLYPSRKKRPGYCIVFAIDTSGSMSEKDLQLAGSELLGLAEQYPGSEILVVQCDSAIEKEFRMKKAEELQTPSGARDLYTFAGRGGTSFQPPFARFLQQERVESKWYAGTEAYDQRLKDFPRKVDCFVYFTDGYAPAPESIFNPKIPVVWVITAGGSEEVVSSSFGSSVKIPASGEE